MKVAFITSSFFPHMGGAEVFLHNLIQSLERKHAVESVLYVPFSFYRYLKKIGFLKQVHYTIRPLPPFLYRLPIPMQWFAKFYLAWEQKRHQFDLWHATFAYPSGYLVSGLKDVPKILRCPGDDIQTESTLDYGMRRNRKVHEKVIHTLKAMDRLVAMGKTMQSEYESLVPEANGKVRVIPNGIPVDSYQGEKDKLSLRKKLQLPSDKKILLTIGRNHKKKGFHNIPKIIERLLPYRNDFVWIVVGSDVSKIQESDAWGYVGKYLFLREELGIPHLKEEVDFFPSKELVRYYQAADVFVFPSLFESFGIVLIEAMAAGLPIVTTDAPGCRDLIQDARNGLKVPANDFAAMAKAVNRFLGDSDFRDRMIEGSRYEVSETYHLDRVTERYFDLYQELQPGVVLSS